MPTAIPLRSSVPGITWPAQPSSLAAAVLAQTQQLEQSEWLSPEVLREHQLAQFSGLVAHAHVESRFYRERFAASGRDPSGAWNEERFRLLPLLTRRELAEFEATVNARRVPPSHGEIRSIQTSGSTGQAVAVRSTALCYVKWLALGLREHRWHRRDFTQSLAVIRPTIPTQDDDARALEIGWGPPASLVYATGPSYAYQSSTDISVLAEWLLRRDPGYLLAYPTCVAALLDWFEANQRTPSRLLQVRTIGEVVTPELRERCQRLLGAPVVDTYSSQEVGAIALQCPDQPNNYHAQSESLLVEVLDDTGQPCAPGEIGRVVVTDLHNFATPLIRYELRDHAEVGEACACGRGLPTLRRVLGRRRNMVVLPDGRRHWPEASFAQYRDIAPIRQYQLVQIAPEVVEVRLVVEGGALSEDQETRLSAVIQTALRHPFGLRFKYSETELAHARSGKFEEFVCLVE